VPDPGFALQSLQCVINGKVSNESFPLRACPDAWYALSDRRRRNLGVNRTRGFLLLDEAHEGIMAARSALTTAAILSLVTGRILVEPCVKGGAIVSCGGGVEGTVPMSSLLQIDSGVWTEMGGVGGGWWPYERFEATAHHLGLDPVLDRATLALPHGRADCIQQGWHELSTVQERLRRAPPIVTLVDQLNQNLCLLDDGVAFDLSLRLFTYPPHLLQAAAQAVRPLLGDGRPLHVIHWRTIHLPSDVFQRCARWVGALIERAAAGPGNPRVFLLSDLPALNDTSLKWADNRYSFAPERVAWQQEVAASPHLIHPTFGDGEELDAGALSLFEQAVAIQAGTLTTCGWMNRTAACGECNYVGKFTRVLLGLRERWGGDWLGLQHGGEGGGDGGGPKTILDWPVVP
jgi:hypothetical protein